MSYNPKQQQIQKQNVATAIENAQQERGQILIITGNGKGKTTAGFGTIFRALGHQQRVAAVQFVKGERACGERSLLTQLGIEVHTMNTGFSWNSEDKQADKQAAQLAWAHAKTLLAEPLLDMVLLDELTYMITWGFIELDDILNALQTRPTQMTVIITGRAAHRKLKEYADTVSEIRPEKHAFAQGLKARIGLDW
ncbi:cob(I)yrinic acid a,c-diamide adenosyltransferase [Shewanella intestini]|uniref:Corrinoid adenosyltransferase n=1 Tax=Shewanella intestini TaxID=2017544 RepID=A0ABS5I1R6_9GAMM|nr:MULTISPECIES: cob(I)yrinic acid a,c-diamide adenosyltransferase [Shewanella]MBR9727942.1 cob(I)yrinic acid a,c-diamide adenosyltransferase [Shewanella intestini]MRG36507.1 cob(I)yrinic acid a,c-diamide adenosyltransferase [Shewanella sp. XMDDZSB0408]